MTKKKRKTKKRTLRLGRLIFLLALVGVLIFGILHLRYQGNIKPIQTTSERVIFTIEPGESLKSITESLEEHGIIRNANAAYTYARRNHYTDLKAGDFEIDKSWDLDTLFTTLSDASLALVDDATVTIIEGDWCSDIAKKICSQTNIQEEELLALWRDRSYLESLKDRYPFITDEMFNENVRYYLEGYLAPNTYKFFQDTTAQEVTEKILDQSLTVYEKYASDMKKSDLSIHQIYTLAGIVQHESSFIEDMRKIAQVFYNRLAIDMPLQSSSTVCYAIEENSGDWFACEVNTDVDSPYNTYLHPGLPPGSIVNAGVDAIDAVLHPDPSAKNYYYFMADVKGDGTVYYAETLEEHNANVARYLQ